MCVRCTKHPYMYGYNDRMALRPLQDRIVLEPDVVKAQTESGIYLPERSQEAPRRGIVRYAGPGRIAPQTGQLVPMEIQVGDHVLYSKYAGSEIDVDGTTMIILREDDVLAVIP